MRLGFSATAGAGSPLVTGAAGASFGAFGARGLRGFTTLVVQQVPLLLPVLVLVGVSVHWPVVISTSSMMNELHVQVLEVVEVELAS